MEYILVLLIVALLNGAIAYIDGLMEGIIPLTLYAEQYMSTLAGVDLFQSLFDIVFGFGVSLIVLKFLKKGFETYVLWSDGDADEEPIAILTNFFKAMAVAICFPTMYDWLATIVEEMSNKMLEAIGLATAYDWAGWVSGISSMGLVTAIFGLVFVIVYFILYFQFLMRGLEILILRVGIPLACVGLIDNVIVDCTSLLTGNVLATTALEVADDVLRVCSCDLKAISYFSSYLSLVADRKFKPEQHIKVLSNTRPYQGGSEYENSFGGVKYRLPYLPSLEEQAATLKLLEPLSGKEAKTYEPVIAAIAGEVFGDGK